VAGDARRQVEHALTPRFPRPGAGGNRPSVFPPLFSPPLCKPGAVRGHGPALAGPLASVSRPAYNAPATRRGACRPGKSVCSWKRCAMKQFVTLLAALAVGLTLLRPAWAADTEAPAGGARLSHDVYF